MEASQVAVTWNGIELTGALEGEFAVTPDPDSCLECGARKVDLGNLDANHAGRWACTRVLAYAVEMARRGDTRVASHALMREDGQRWTKENGL